MNTAGDLLSIRRSIEGLASDCQFLLVTRYRRLLPLLLLFLRPKDISERNRAWPGVSPFGKGATRLLTIKATRTVRARIKEYAADHQENVEELWLLLRAYCRYGPVGLIDALPSDLLSPIAPELQECADFHRLAKHPRSDAGIYIRSLLDQYADDLGVPRLPAFVARYAWASDRLIERWFVGEGDRTEHVTQTIRRLNLRLPYPHQHWCLRTAQLPFQVLLAQRHPRLVSPWVCWCDDTYTNTLTE